MIKKLTPNELDILGTLEQLAQVSQEYGIDVNFAQLPDSRELKQQLLLEYLTESVTDHSLVASNPRLQKLIAEFACACDSESSELQRDDSIFAESDNPNKQASADSVSELEVNPRFSEELTPASRFIGEQEVGKQAYQSYKSWLVYDQLWEKFNSHAESSASVLLIRQYKSLFPQSIRLLQEQHALYHLAQEQEVEFLDPGKVFSTLPGESSLVVGNIAYCINRSRRITYQLEADSSEFGLSAEQQEVFNKPYFAYYANLNRRLLFGEVEIDEDSNITRYIPGILLLPNLTLVLTSEQLLKDPELLSDLSKALEQEYFTEAQAFCRNPKLAQRQYQQYACTAKIIILAGLQAFRHLDYELGALAAQNKVQYVSNQYWDDTSFLRTATEYQRNFYLQSYQQDFLASRYVFSDLKEVEMEQLLYQNLEGFERMFKQLSLDSAENFKKIVNYLFLSEVSWYSFNPLAASKRIEEVAESIASVTETTTTVAPARYKYITPLFEQATLETDYMVNGLLPSDKYNLEKAFVVSPDNKANLADSLSSESAQHLKAVLNQIQQPFAESSEKLNSYLPELGYLYTNFRGVLLDPLVIEQVFSQLAKQRLKGLTATQLSELTAVELEQGLAEDFEEFFAETSFILPTPEFMANNSVAKDLSLPGLKLLNPASVYEHAKLGLPILRDRIAVLDDYLEAAQVSCQQKYSKELEQATTLQSDSREQSTVNLSAEQLALLQTIAPETRDFLQKISFSRTKLASGSELAYLTELYLHLHKLASNQDFFNQLASNLSHSLFADRATKLELSGVRLQRLFQETSLLEQIFSQVEEMFTGYLNLIIKQHYLANLTDSGSASAKASKTKLALNRFNLANLVSNLEQFTQNLAEAETEDLATEVEVRIEGEELEAELSASAADFEAEVEQEFALLPVYDSESEQSRDRIFDLSLHNLLILEQFKLSENNYRIYWYGSLVQELIIKSKAQAAKLEQIIDLRRLDHSLSYQENLELLKQNFYYLDTSYRKIGQVNGLAVMENPDPDKEDQGTVFRISTITHPEGGHYADVDGELDLAGKFAMRANLISKSYLNSLFSEPLDFQGAIVTEQLYEETDGDSASLASFVVLASSLSEIPIKQSLAITGSMSQFGEAQAVGGVNQKIKAFFDVCNALDGMTGLQGVIIPQVNEQTIQLAPDILEQVRLGNFSIYSVEQALEAWEIISDVRGLDEKNEKEIYSLTPFSNDKEKDKEKSKSEDKETPSEAPTLAVRGNGSYLLRPQANFADLSWRQAYPHQQSLVEVLQKKFSKEEEKNLGVLDWLKLSLRWNIMLLLLVILLIYIYIGIKLVLPLL